MHLVPELKYSTIGCINFVKKKFKENSWFDYKYLKYINDFIFSQIARFDLYSDIYFILICVEQKQYDIAIASAVVLIINILMLVWMFLMLIFKKKQKKETYLAEDINRYFEVSLLVEFNALSNILDIVAPYNIVEIQGKTVSKYLFHHFTKFLIEDFP